LQYCYIIDENEKYVYFCRMFNNSDIKMALEEPEEDSSYSEIKEEKIGRQTQYFELIVDKTY